MPHMILYDIIWYLSFSVWLTSFSMTISRSFHVAANGIISFFLWLSNILCIYVPHLLYPFLCWWTFRLLPCLGYCKWCCNEHWGALPFQIMVFSGYIYPGYVLDIYTEKASSLNGSKSRTYSIRGSGNYTRQHMCTLGLALRQHRIHVS